MAYLPQHKILFAADLAFFHLTPYCHNAYVSKWMESMEKVMKWDVDVIVPGHGPVGGKKDLAEALDYFRFLKPEVGKTILTLGNDSRRSRRYHQNGQV